ncbi:peptidase S10, serine carboxypeptidase [Obelidium mucronatum]|nr:peptidase S10, serine carboxypeptidase [Obelidium mucronatum]
MVPADFLVSSLPQQTPAQTAFLRDQFAGYLPITAVANASNPNNYFFWYFPSTNVSSTNLVVWLNGGPGCSSLFGSWVENGPIRMNGNGSLSINEHSWHKQANLLYVEQPVGTGFDVDQTYKSYDQYDVGAYFAGFLTNFYNVFNATRSFDLFITGESYAGVYIPYIAKTLLAQNQAGKAAKVNLKGIGIGDGVLNTDIQFAYNNQGIYTDFLRSAGFFNQNPAIESPATALVEQCKTAKSELQASQMLFSCDVMSYVMELYSQSHSELGANNTCFDVYNIDYQIPCNQSDYLYEAEARLTTYLNTKSVQDAIHVTPLLSQAATNTFNGPRYQWNACSNIYLNDTSNPQSHTLIDAILAAGIKVVLYEGDRDLLVNFIGMEQAIGNMTWAGQKGFSVNKTGVPWTVNGSTAGVIWNERGLSYIRVTGAGHMVPTDQPLRAAAVLSHLLSEPVPAVRSGTVSNAPLLFSFSFISTIFLIMS